jgi:hypothetical protein
MTRQDFIVSVLASISAAIGFEFARKGLIYLRSKKFRKARKRFVRNSIQTVNAVRALAFMRVETAIAFSSMLLALGAWFVLSHSTEQVARVSQEMGPSIAQSRERPSLLNINPVSVVRPQDYTHRVKRKANPPKPTIENQPDVGATNVVSYASFGGTVFAGGCYR